MAVSKLSSRGGVYSIGDSNLALTAATAKVVWMLKPLSLSVRLVHWTVAFDGTSASAEPVDIQLVRFSADGNKSDATVYKLDGNAATATSSAFKTFTSTMPAITDLVWQSMLHPQGGRLDVWYNDPLIAPVSRTGDTDPRIGLRVTAAAAVNVTSTVFWEEF